MSGAKIGRLGGRGKMGFDGDFPPSGTVYYYFRIWRDNGLLEVLSQEMAGGYRQSLNRARTPSVGIIDAQSVKTTAVSGQSCTGYDAGKKVKGRKRHIVVDTQGLIICAWVTAADWQDRTAAYWLFIKMYINRVDFPRLRVFFADGGYAGKLIDFVKNQFEKLAWQLHIVKKAENSNTFKVLPKRWIVERTFAWLDNCRRLSTDYERKTTSSEAFTHLEQVRLLAIKYKKT
ncbi:MAG: IS5 family transposase [Lewinellaceae bacterium]|nr:IS5 family transposase [Lewinellaceae bacterium]